MQLRWIHVGKRRYYAVYAQPDLFGFWVVARVWGSLDSNRGQTRLEAFASESQAREAIETIRKRRMQRGYSAGGGLD